MNVLPLKTNVIGVNSYPVEEGVVDEEVAMDLDPRSKQAPEMSDRNMIQSMVWVPAPDENEVNFRGLSEGEVIARRKQGLGNNMTFNTSRSSSQILRENLFTFFNMVLVILGVLLIAFGAALEAFITSGVLLINVVVATVQEIRAKKMLDQIALVSRPTATVIRESREQEVEPAELVWGDLLVVKSGDQIVVDGRIVSQGRLEVDESLLTGESRLVTKREGDQVQSGSFCVTGRGVYEATRVGLNSYANKLTLEARTFTRRLTPLQREVNLVIRVLLGLAVFFGILLIINNLLNLFLFVTIAIFSTAYFLINGKELRQSIMDSLPLRSQHKKQISARLDETVNAIIAGNIGTALLQGVISGVIFSAAGVPAAWREYP